MTMSRQLHLIRSRDELVTFCNEGGKARFLFFWGHTPRHEDVPDRSCLSQWFPSPFELDGILYLTAEHWMMAEKARLFGDREAEEKVLSCMEPGEAKKRGREIRGFDGETWYQKRFEIVVRGNLAKFSQHVRLRDFLCSTGTQVLVEASPVDTIWGVGLAADHADASAPSRWRGLNLLGFALMEVRELLQGDCCSA